MKYQIRHTTRYVYSDPVPACHNQVHLAPRSMTNQSCHDFNLLLSPAPVERHRRLDYFGNQVDSFSIHEAHMGLTVTADSVVEVQKWTPPAPSSTVPWEQLVKTLKESRRPDHIAAYAYVFPSRYVPIKSQYGEFARSAFPAGRPILEAVLELTRKIHKEFRYDPRATTIHTKLSDVYTQKAGVCQDFAHLQIACLRSLGLAARYVSGYLRTLPPPGKPRLVGADASHAWLSVYCGEVGWIDFDPTNNTIPGLDHITVAWGRDYADVCPIQGVVLGGGNHVMSVSVDVEAIS